jgi:hypothetical protein
MRPVKWSLPKRWIFPGAVTHGFDLQDARLMIASALEQP